MARKPVELAREWLSAAEDSDVDGMAELLADDALFHADLIRGRRFRGREEIEDYLAQTGFEATGYSYTGVDDVYAVVTLSLRRKIDGGGIADSTLAMVFRIEHGEIICMDAFPTARAAFASLAKSNANAA